MGGIETPAAMWLEGEPLQNVLARMQPHIELLKETRAAQDAPVKA
jgi:hypothetical protein